jgi:protein-disulfide isomerase
MMPKLHTSISAHDFHQGGLDAPIQIVHFGDFECPYSGALYATIKQLQEEERARLLYVFRPFPLSDIHPHAHIAARAAYAANEQGQFWPMYDALFQNQNSLGATFLKMYAEDLGLDNAKFEADFRSDKYDAQIAQSVEEAHASGAHGTPTLYINGQFHDNREGLWKIHPLRNAVKAITS